MCMFVCVYSAGYMEVRGRLMGFVSVVYIGPVGAQASGKFCLHLSSHFKSLGPGW